MARVVVLMPVYNGGAYLRRAIDSILGQSFTDFELLIIDDASTDNGQDIIESNADPRINYKRNEQNLGVARTLNRGLELADCEYLVRMDADDISLLRRLEWQIAFMDSHPTIGVSGTWLKAFGSPTTRGVVKYLGEHESIRACLLFCTPMAHPTVIIRHAEWAKEKLFYDPDFSRTEDFELWSRAAQKVRLGNLSKVALRFRRHPTSATLANWDQMIDQYDWIVKRELELIGIIPAHDELRLHVKLGLNGRADSLVELQSAERWLEYVQQKAVTEGYERAGVEEAVSLVWYRFARNAAWLGRESEKACYASGLLIRDSISIKEKALFKAATLFHAARGKGK